METEHQIRLAAFRWLESQSAADDVLSWSLLQKGFVFRGRQITLVGPQGIWKPKAFATMPLSITTSPNSPYSDFMRGGYLSYSYRGTDPKHPDNVGLEKAMLERVPLIYFCGIATGKYVAAWPVFVVDANPKSLTFTVSVDDSKFIEAKDLAEADQLRRQYITTSFKTRVHQRAFRTRVLEAYRSQCAFCQLKHAELLDAAHIIPDKHPQGEPLITNGLSLCKIHHAAFDRHFIGVTRDYEIVVREELMLEEDGPMLRHGIQGIHQKTLILPKNRKHWPDQDRLATRFDSFRRVI